MKNLFHYDKNQRKIRGVYYTPEPVVSFIVRSIEKVLKESLSSFTKGKTLILVTHRKSLLDLVEKILVVSNGNLVNFGSKEQILKAGQEGCTDA